MARRTKAAPVAPPSPVESALMPSMDARALAQEILAPGTSPFAGLDYNTVIETLVENINEMFVDNDCSLQDAKVAIDAFKDQLLAMTSASEGPRAAQELAFQFMQGCLPYIFNPELDEDPRGSFKSILDSVRENLERKTDGSEAKDAT